ncbi:MAG: hypothetical protein AMJ75_05735, partial [Phycisphaerae bacterium SM1_79]
EGLMPSIKLALEGCLGKRPRLPRILNKPGPGILKGIVKDTADTYYHMANMFFVPVENWPGKPAFYYLAVVNESFEITGVPPGSYYLFAIEAQNTESIDTVGLPIDWPRPVTIDADGKVAHVEIEMSTFLSKEARFWNVQGFLRGVGHLNALNASVEELGPYGRIVDVGGNPVPYATVQVREFKANRGEGEGIAAPDARTNEQGYYGLRPLDYPYFVGAIVHDPLINAAGHRWQYIQRNKVFEGKQAINFEFKPWPSVTRSGGIIEGTVVDAKDNPIPSFIVDVRPAGPWPKVNETSEPWYESWGFRAAFAGGKFALGDVPEGICNVRIMSHETSAERGDTLGQREVTVSTGQTKHLEFQIEDWEKKRRQRIYVTPFRLVSKQESGVKTAVPVEGEGGWGEAVEGVQVRLRADKYTWEAEEKPVFKADIRNRGELELYVHAADEFCQLEIDGEWHGWSGPWGKIDVKQSPLGHGSQINNISISLAKTWVGKKSVLALTAGVHTVRVAFILQRSEREYQNIVRAVSNPVEIEIVPVKAKTAVEVEAGEEALTAEKLVLKLVDNSGRPVAGAKVGTSVRTRDEQVLNSKLYWSLSSKEKDVSNEDGKIVLTRDKLFPQSWNPDRRRALYILNEERQIGAFCEISKDDERNQIELTLEPVCHVHGKLSSEDLEEIGRPLTWSNVYLGFNKDSQSVLSCMSEKQQFEFWVPPGEYELSAYGSGEGASTKHVRPTIEVKTGQSELDLGVVDLPATKLSTLIGKPAPEIGPIKAWKNGSPITLAELRGKAVIIYFDGTSPNTSRDLPQLVDLHNQFEANGLVIVALYNCPSMEALEAKWVEVYKKYGGVQNVPFRVAVDGGKSTFYEGSDKERPGATYAIYDITADPTTILIDPDGKIVGKLGLYGAKEKLGNMLGVEVKTTVSTWRQRFEEVYRLEDNRILKRIAPPFIPERRDYYVNENSSQASAISTSPGIFVFHWNGKLKNWGLSFTDKLDLNFLLGFVLRLKSFEYDGPEELLSIELPGDWIIRDEVSQKIKLKALEQLIDEELGRTIQFEKRTVERQVIVVTGNFKFHPPSETYEHKSVHLYSDELDPDEGSGGGTADSVNDFILRLGSLVDMPVADHTESSKKILVPYRHHRSSYLRRIKDKAEKAGKLQMLLANLTKQTELQFRIEKRPVEVWFITEKKKDK